MKRISLVVLASLLLFNLQAQRPTGRPSGRQAVQTQISLEGTTFHLRNVMANKYIDLPGKDTDSRSRDNGANVQLWDLDSGNDRKMEFVPAGNGYHHIRFHHANVQLDVHGCFSGTWFCGTYKDEKGANVQIWKSGDSEPQQWKLEQVNPGQFRIKNRYSDKYLDARKSDIHKNGCNVLQWDWNGGENQLWELVCVKTGTRYQE